MSPYKNDGPGDVKGENSVTEAEIRAQLDRILEHKEFEATDRLRDFLVFVVEESLAGRAAQIKGRLIARRVFGRGEDFDPGRDPVVRIEAGRLRRRLEHYYFVAGEQDPIRIEIPKGRYVPRFTRQGRRPAVTGGKDERERPSLDKDVPTIAILPFRDLTSEPRWMFFASGLVEELVNEVNHYEQVTAVPCRPVGVQDDGDALCRGARFLLEGSVRRDETELKIAAYLTDTVLVRQVWGQSYKVPLDASRLIRTQEQLARDVMAALADEYGVIARRMIRESRHKPPVELSSYEALLRYHHYMLLLTEEAAHEALTALSQATESEPGYGPAWAAMANLYAHAWILDRPGVQEPLATALEYARRSVSLTPDSQLARTIMSYVWLLRGDMSRFTAEVEAALALNPHSPNYSGTIGYMLAMAGELDRGEKLLRRAIGVSPSHPVWFHDALFIVHYRRGEFEEALDEVERVHHRASFWGYVQIAAALGMLGRIDEANTAMRELRQSKPDFEQRVMELLPRTGTPSEFWPDLLEGLRRAGLRVED
jgi:TolB-like protein/Tfp pilus assembly protein PilF